MDDIKTKLIGMVDQMFGAEVAAEMQQGKTVFVNHGGAIPPDGDYLDSLDRVEFAMAIEDEFDIKVPDVIHKDWQNIDQVAEYVSTIVSRPLHGEG